jgi:hypothetical protein
MMKRGSVGSGAAMGSRGTHSERVFAWFWRSWRCSATLLLTGVLAAGLQASPSWEATMNYQGQLADSAGLAVTDSAYSIQFTIYDAATGGSIVWQETQPGVQVRKGLFNVILGSVVPINLGANYGNDLWLAAKVGADSEMTPRQQILPAVYAYSAKRLNGAVVGTGPGNIPQLDGSGKIPASMIGGGSLSLPVDLSGPGGPYNLHVNNSSALGVGVISESSTGVAVSATTSSTGAPALWADGARYGATVRTSDAVAGVALQAQGPAAAYASLIDRVNNAQVFGLASVASTYGVLGGNSNAAGNGVGGQGGFAGVSGSGGSYGLYGQGAIAGVYAASASTSGKGVYGLASGGSGATYGVYGLDNSVAGIGVGGYYTAGAAGTARGVQGSSNSSTGIGVEGLGYNGVRGTSTAVNGSGVFGTASDPSGVGAYIENSSSGAGAIALAVRSLTSTSGVGVQAMGGAGTGTGLSATGGAYGVIGFGKTAGGYFSNSSAISPSAGVIANGYTAGLSATAATGYAVEASGYGGGNFIASGGYGLNVSSASSWGMQVTAANSYAMINYSSGGSYSQASAGRGYVGVGTLDGVLGYSSAVSAGSGVYGYIVCPACAGVTGYNAGGTSGSNGVFGQGFSAIRAQSTNSQTNSINFESDATNNPQYGFYHFNGAAANNSFGMLLQNTGNSAIGAQITNQAPSGNSTGSALVVKGRLRLTDCSGRVNITNGLLATSWVINSSVIGTAGANCVEPTSVIVITPITNTNNNLLYVSSAGNGTFTVNCALAQTNPQFYYAIFGK